MDKVTKLDAIKTLEKAFEVMPEYKKKWTDYIELIVIEELHEANITLSFKKAQQLREAIAASVIRLFQADWWEFQKDDDAKV